MLSQGGSESIFVDVVDVLFQSDVYTVFGLAYVVFIAVCAGDDVYCIGSLESKSSHGRVGGVAVSVGDEFPVPVVSAVFCVWLWSMVRVFGVYQYVL